MNILSEYDLHDLGKANIPYDELYAKYQNALETIIHYEEHIYELNQNLDEYEEAYEEISNKYYG